MDANEIIAALESLPHGGSMAISCSGSQKSVTFAAFTGVGRQCVRATAAALSLASGMDSAFAELQVKLQAANP